MGVLVKPPELEDQTEGGIITGSLLTAATAACPSCKGAGGVLSRECGKCGGSGRVAVSTEGTIPWKGVVFMANESETGLRPGEMVLVNGYSWRRTGVSEWPERLDEWLDDPGGDIRVWAGTFWANPAKWDRVAFVMPDAIPLRIGERAALVPEPHVVSASGAVDVPAGVVPQGGIVVTTRGVIGRRESVSIGGIVMPDRFIPTAHRSTETHHVRTVLAVGPKVVGMKPGDLVLVTSDAPLGGGDNYEFRSCDSVIATIQTAVED